MADVQTEKGHVKIANELFEAILAANLTKRQWAVYMGVIRLIYGWRKTHGPVSPRLLEKLCGLNRKHVQRTLKELTELNMLELLEPGLGTRPPTYRIVKDYETWLLEGPKQPLYRGAKTAPLDCLGGQNSPSIGGPKQPLYEKSNKLAGPKQPPLEGPKQPPTKDKRHDLDYPTEDLRSPYQTSQPAAAKRQQKKIQDCWKIICDRCLHLASTPPPQTRKTLDAWITRSQLDGYTPQQIQQACFDSATAAMERRARDPSIRSTWRLAITELDAHLRRPPPQTLYEQLT